jgi:hypothetical protein
MKNIFLSVVASTMLFVGVAEAKCPGHRLFNRVFHHSHGCTQPVEGFRRRIVQCFSADNKVAARVYLRWGRAIVYKQDPSLPYYWLDCTAATTSNAWLSCSHHSNRTLIVNKDYTARYIGSHATHELTCTLQ